MAEPSGLSEASLCGVVSVKSWWRGGWQGCQMFNLKLLEILYQKIPPFEGKDV